jgi:CheY-like chemotaxis protein
MPREEAGQRIVLQATAVARDGSMTDEVSEFRGNAPVASPRLEESPDGERGRPAHILVVDDDATMRHMIASYLEQQGMSVTSASQARDAARQLAAREPALVILDLRLGQEDGLDLLRQTRSRSDVPVIIVTGNRVDEIDRVVGLELGADDYITKPVALRAAGACSRRAAPPGSGERRLTTRSAAWPQPVRRLAVGPPRTASDRP